MRRGQASYAGLIVLAAVLVGLYSITRQGAAVNPEPATEVPADWQAALPQPPVWANGTGSTGLPVGPGAPGGPIVPPGVSEASWPGEPIVPPGSGDTGTWADMTSPSEASGPDTQATSDTSPKAPNPDEELSPAAQGKRTQSLESSQPQGQQPSRTPRTQRVACASHKHSKPAQSSTSVTRRCSRAATRAPRHRPQQDRDLDDGCPELAEVWPGGDLPARWGRITRHRDQAEDTEAEGSPTFRRLITGRCGSLSAGRWIREQAD
ncbi:MAG: hypothetical protein N2512_08950 [Armatimonadetes bacterium]|nr:hypothetical protein [Armatimonadota bacterium]